MTTLGYAILGLLADAPRTGYEIARRMDTPIGYYWTARHSQIYPELARLEADKLVRHEVVPGPGPRDTKRYTLTRAGRTTLRQWVASPLPPQPERSELLLRTRWLWLASPEQAADFLRTVRAERERRLETYREEERRLRAAPRRPRPSCRPRRPVGAGLLAAGDDPQRPVLRGAPRALVRRRARRAQRRTGSSLTAARPVARSDQTTDPPTSTATTASDHSVGTLMSTASSSIFTPTHTSTADRPVLR